jgi:drug/metabolite transporter (DMT)-like permease
LPGRVWAVGLYGLFGYHFFYFMAQRNAPAVEASLIAYLWPLFMVALALLLPGVHFHWYHILGIGLGFVGAAVLVTRGAGLALDPAYRLGYTCALACAFIWASYTMLTRRLSHVPTSAVGAYCGVTAVLALVCHLLFEETAWPVGWQWLAVAGLGLGPVGVAFYSWDFGVKRGDIRALGAFSYAAPLLSTLLLIVFGRAPGSWYVMAACVLIVGGAVLAAVDTFR